MKKVMTFILLLFLANDFCAQVRIGVLGGMNISTVKQKNLVGPELKSRVKYAIGGLIEYSPFKNLSFVAEPMYIEKGTESEVELISLPGLDMSFDVEYIEIPFLLKYSVGDKVRPYFLAGATLGIAINSSAKFDIGPLDLELGLGDFTNSSDLAFTFGTGISVAVDELMILQLEAKYSFGINNLLRTGKTRISILDKFELIDIPDDMRYLNRGFQLLIGVSFPLVFE